MYTLVSGLDEEPQPKDDVRLLHSPPEPSRCVVVLRTSSNTNATDRIEMEEGSDFSSPVKASKKQNKNSVNTH